MSQIILVRSNLPQLFAALVSLIAILVFLFIPSDSLDITVVYQAF